ncbi:MAG: hypothetical protein KA240_00020 [Nitrospira sp.]|nr:hypothetical protein [Nitrospira sp.]
MRCLQGDRGRLRLHESCLIEHLSVRRPYGLPPQRQRTGLCHQQRRAKLVDQVSGSLLGGVRGEVLERAFQYWKNIDADIGKRVEARVQAGGAPRPAKGIGKG